MTISLMAVAVMMTNEKLMKTMNIFIIIKHKDNDNNVDAAAVDNDDVDNNR